MNNIAFVAAVFVVSSSLFAGCSRAAAGGRSIPPPPPESTTLGPGDVFEVRVLGDKDLTAPYQVDTEGKIRFPFLGDIAVAGKTPAQVAEIIERGLRDGQYFRAPQVSVFVRESNSRRISVLGAVKKPGSFPLTPGLTVVQAIVLAGGLTSMADSNGTVVTRRGEEGLQRFQVPVGKIQGGRADDISLAAGDIVFVPERIF